MGVSTSNPNNGMFRNPLAQNLPGQNMRLPLEATMRPAGGFVSPIIRPPSDGMVDPGRDTIDSKFREARKLFPKGGAPPGDTPMTNSISAGLLTPGAPNPSEMISGMGSMHAVNPVVPTNPSQPTSQPVGQPITKNRKAKQRGAFDPTSFSDPYEAEKAKRLRMY